MFVTDKIIYLDLNKTGCTHIRNMLEETIGGYRSGKHNRIDFPIDKKKVIGSIRNPWDWYVSLWAYGCSGKGSIRGVTTSEHSMFRQYLGQMVGEVKTGRLFPSKSIANIIANSQKPIRKWKDSYSDSADPEKFRQWLRMVYDPSRRYDLGEGYAQSTIWKQTGLLTYRYLWLYSRNIEFLKSNKLIQNYNEISEIDTKENLLYCTIKTESLEYDLLKCLDLCGYTLTSDQKEKILLGSQEKLNISIHKKPIFYYDEETIELVRKKERLIISKYNYSGPSH